MSSALTSVQNKLSSHEIIDTSSTGEIGVGAKRKTKYVPLYSTEGLAKSVIQLPGRHICECQAAKHKLINNCTNCGRIVCEQERAGPCVFCGTLVCTPEDQEIIDRGTKKGEKLRQQLLKIGSQPAGNSENSSLSIAPVLQNKFKQGFDQALQHRDKLLEFDRTSVRRTQVIDDECDYYATDSNQWLNTEEREKLRKREEELRNSRHGSRRDRKITFDFAGRRVIDAENDIARTMYSRDDEVVQQVHYAKPSVENNSNEIINPDIQCQPPKFVDSVPWGPNRSDQDNENSDNFNPSQSSSHRIQDKQLQEISDDGMCLSMHQPWASLLVAGIKMHEGRTWYTAHRGRLWIASTAKPVAPEDIKEHEHVYTHLYNGSSLKFPKEYPTGCLLGCVNVEDCLSQEEYREQYPDGESASPYVFICSNPQHLIVKYPNKGKHKIYKLDRNIHQAAKKCIR
uniref:ASCH domain-containing protein n=2 Tax=Arion vulgaris TaxID=1028688 RepID=A0A0B6ZWX8_9EUPU